MNLFKKHLVRFVKDEAGQSTTEYILILSVVVMIAMKFKKTIGDKLEGIVGNVSNQMDEATRGGDG